MTKKGSRAKAKVAKRQEQKHHKDRHGHGQRANQGSDPGTCVWRALLQGLHGFKATPRNESELCQSIKFAMKTKWTDAMRLQAEAPRVGQEVNFNDDDYVHIDSPKAEAGQRDNIEQPLDLGAGGCDASEHVTTNCQRRRNRGVISALWQGMPLSNREENEAIVAIQGMQVANGYLCSACDPLLLAYSTEYRVNVQHKMCGIEFNYTVNAARRSVRLMSTSGHMSHVGNTELKNSKKTLRVQNHVGTGSGSNGKRASRKHRDGERDWCILSACE